MGVSQGIDGAVGLGVDIVDIARMRRILERTPSFARKVYSDEERAYCLDKANARSAFRHAVRREGGRWSRRWAQAFRGASACAT